MIVCLLSSVNLPNRRGHVRPSEASEPYLCLSLSQWLMAPEDGDTEKEKGLARTCPNVQNLPVLPPAASPTTLPLPSGQVEDRARWCHFVSSGTAFPL